MNEVGLVPDLVAGASVGSISAALIAEVFHAEKKERPGKIAELASIFLAIDRLVLTDRFADFMRRLTLRAAETRFSLSDADRFFRRYDVNGFDRFNRRSRRVVAGLERLLCINPFQLKELTKAMRNRDTGSVNRQVRAYLQEFVNRSGCGQEILGAEPLVLLLRKFVLENHHKVDPDSALFDLFLKDGMHLLATATNLTQGKLEILSSVANDSRTRVLLKEGLLASSAFPAVFRPRWAWEMFLEANDDQFVDGGVMDNLPLEAVITFLHTAAKKQWIKPQPKVGNLLVPHLLFTASLEVQRPKLSETKLRDVVDSWPELRQYAKTLRYNQKLDKFADAQRDFRFIRQNQSTAGSKQLLDIETVVVKPEWLPGTFAFHAMLGFRRAKQAASIAHGCASTLVELHRRAKAAPDTFAEWAKVWGVTDRVVADCADGKFPVPQENVKNDGDCWFRESVPCPFTPQGLARLSPEASDRLPPATRNELMEIYRACGKAATHCPSNAEA